MRFLNTDDLTYYAAVAEELPGFWQRFGGKPDFRDKKVLDLGCGHGVLVNSIALDGAHRVVGLDLNQALIDFATQYQQEQYPQLNNVVEFRNMDIREYPEDDFDYMVSKATFEHVLELDTVIAAMRDRLKPGGRIYTGFGPLYYSPVGDHGRTLSKLPWQHAFRSHDAIIRAVNQQRAPDDPITSIYDLGMNLLTPAEYREIFKQSGMTIVLYRENAIMPNSSLPRKLVGFAMNALKQVPFLEKYMTVNIWCVLEKR
ncbi:MAG: class I SAM-dependent methyltransferase [Chloroflexi bacterium]|nr:MAG: class I SAM-dependent methyltransferase [Chloroflexota bacterium]